VTLAAAIRSLPVWAIRQLPSSEIVALSLSNPRREAPDS
jgi:hypothetical protein